MESTIDRCLAAFERCHRVLVTVHDLDGSLAGLVHPVRSRHRHPVCEEIKATASGSPGKRCFQFEKIELHPSIHQWPHGRFHRCHAGLIEWMVPVPGPDSAPSAILFAGPRRWAGPPEGLYDTQIQAHPRLHELDSIDAQYATDLLELLHQLALRVAQLRAEAPALHRLDPRNRRDILTRLIEINGHEAIDLGDLAMRWGVSRSRAGHLVSELTGRSWRTLLTDHRLRVACHLLRSSDLSLPAIAERSGFGDRISFNRIFRREYGCTPGRWRRQRDS